MKLCSNALQFKHVILNPIKVRAHNCKSHQTMWFEIHICPLILNILMCISTLTLILIFNWIDHSKKATWTNIQSIKVQSRLFKVRFWAIEVKPRWVKEVRMPTNAFNTTKTTTNAFNTTKTINRLNQ